MNTKVEISKRLVLINSASSVAAHSINIFVLVWLQQYLLRRISPEEYSIYPVVMAVMVFVPLLTTILTSGLARYIVEAYAKGDERGVTQIVSTMFPMLVAAGLILLALGWTFAWYVGKVLTVAPDRLLDARIMMGLLVFSAAIRLPLAPFQVGPYVRQKFVLLNAIGVCRELLRIALLFILVLGVSVRVLWVVVASVSAELGYLTILPTISRRLIPALKFRFSEIRWDKAVSLISFGGWSFLLQLADTIRTSSDAIILNKLGTAIDVTNFHLGSMFFSHVQTTSYLVREPLGPPLTAMYATGAEERLGRAYLRGGRYALWASLFMALPMIIYRKEIITLYVGEKYIAAATVMALLLATFPIDYGNVMMGYLAQAKADLRPWAIRAMISHTVNLVLTLYLVGALGMGAVGSALATFMVYLVFEPLLYWPLGLRLAGVDCRTWFNETIRLGFLPGIVAAIVWLGLRIIVKPETWLSLGFCTLIGMICFCICLFGSCLTRPDRGDLQELIRKTRAALRLCRSVD